MSLFKELRNITYYIKFLFLISLLRPVLMFGSESWKLYDDSQVAIVEITVDLEDLDWIYDNVHSDSLHPAGFRFVNSWIDETVDSIGFRLRGNTSRTSAKKSFKVSFNTFVPARQFYGVDKLNLNGEHNDPSIIRSKLCWDIFQDIGITASRAAHVAVYINDEYYGLYISVEHIDDEFLENYYPDDSGNLWKCLWPADLVYLGDDPELYKYYAGNRQPYDLKTNTDEDDYSQLARLIDIINNTPDNLLADSLETILIVPEVLKYFAINVLVGGWDDYWFLKNNYYLYHNPTEGRFHWIPYDYDNTFGIDWFNIDWTSVNPYIFANIDDTPRPLVERIMANAQYRNLYSHFLEFYRDNVYDLSLWESRIDSLKTMITPWAEADSYRTLDWGFTINDFHDSYTTGSYSNQHVKRGIKEFVNLRNNSLNSQITWMAATPIVYTIDWWPKVPQPDDTIHVTVAAFSSVGLSDVSIQYHPGDLTVIYTYPMVFQPLSETQKVEEADCWVGTIPPLGVGGYGLFEISATDINQQTQIYPRTDFITVQSPAVNTSQVVINEFLARNDAINTDGAGEYDDWVELYNPTSKDVFLNGMYLTDNSDDLTKWQFPFGGVGIASNEYLLIWCDDDLNQPGLHANFKISTDGEFIALVAGDGVTIIDSLTFGPQSADVSYGRNPDGSDTWEYFISPTPAVPNSTSSIAENSVSPQNCVLFQNYPNPFNPTTTFKYELPNESKVVLSVFDINGCLVETIVSKNQAADFYSVQWDASNVPSGVYFYRIQVNDPANGGAYGFTAVKKCLLIK